MAVLTLADFGRAWFGHRTPPGRLVALALVSGASGLLPLTTPTELRAQAAVPNEDEIKALFVFNFVQFVQWPDAVFASADTPIRIGILGEDSFAAALEATVQGEKAWQREITIKRSPRLADLRDCHVVVVTRSAAAQVTATLAAFRSKPVLTVGDIPDFARRGGIINFYREGPKVRFEINRAAAQQSGLKLSSQLLGLARIVGSSAEEGGK